ncbi:MAG: DUF1987 domain-containing protein [Bacteroidota bacterium]
METTNLSNLEIQGEKGTYFTPHVSFDAQSGHCLLEGESYLEETWEFYGNLVTWLRTYAKTGRPIHFDIKLTYFNTSSSKGILEVLDFLDEYHQQGGTVVLRWYYPKDDEDLLEEAEVFSEDIDLGMEIIPS